MLILKNITPRLNRRRCRVAAGSPSEDDNFSFSYWPSSCDDSIRENRKCTSAFGGVDEVVTCSNTADPTSGLFLRRDFWCIYNFSANNKAFAHKKATRINRFFYILSHGRLHFLTKCLIFVNLTKFHLINVPERGSPVVSRHRTPESSFRLNKCY